MNRDDAATVFESLASGIRLDAFRLLVRQGPAGMVAGDIASALDIAPNKLSFHLKSLLHAGLATVEQEGRFQRYRPNIALVAELVAYLTAECCGGRPEACADLLATPCCPEATVEVDENNDANT